MRREKLKDTEFVKQWSDNFEEYGTLANAYDWTETPEGDEFWDLINQGKLPEIPASSLAELAEWQKSKGEKVEPTHEPTLIGGKTEQEWLFYFAGQAMQGLMSNPTWIEGSMGDIITANNSVAFAKALLTQLKKEVENV